MGTGKRAAALALAANEGGLFCLRSAVPREVRLDRGALLHGRRASVDLIATIACREIVRDASPAWSEAEVRAEVERRGFRYVMPDSNGPK